MIAIGFELIGTSAIRQVLTFLVAMANGSTFVGKLELEHSQFEKRRR
jgi:hypothetical protein